MIHDPDDACPTLPTPSEVAVNEVHLELVRGERYMDAHGGVEGVRLTLCVVDAEGLVRCKLPCIERGGNYVRLAVGSYRLAPTEYHGQRALRVVAHGDGSPWPAWPRILIHAGNVPSDSTGCVLPGLVPNARGVGQSRAAMGRLFEAIGVAKLPLLLRVFEAPSGKA